MAYNVKPARTVGSSHFGYSDEMLANVAVLRRNRNSSGGKHRDNDAEVI